jgi:hydroxymethylpyrimidine/phosphomethylpyrimidine kinase
MNPGTLNIPVVLAFAGHDPSGGAGLQADIEALASQGCHAATVVTALTVQDTQDVVGYTAVDAIQVITQARAILEDMPVAVFKIGMLGSIENAEAVHSILMDYPEIPVVFDPVLASGHGTDLGGQELIEVLQALLLPVTTILTPNGPEARALAPEADTLDACALALLDHGVDYVLVTGSHERTPSVINRLYGGQRLLETFTWERLPHSYHGPAAPWRRVSPVCWHRDWNRLRPFTRRRTTLGIPCATVIVPGWVSICPTDSSGPVTTGTEWKPRYHPADCMPSRTVACFPGGR